MTLATLTLLIHIGSGFLALAVGPVAMIARKGARLHRSAGKVFVWAMFAVVATAAGLALWNPNTFLLAIAVISFHLTFTGWRAATRHGARSGPGPLDWFVSGATLLFGVGLIVVGLAAGGLAASESPDPAAVALGVVTAALALPQLIRLRKGTARKGWFFLHIIGMLSAYIATFTAFAVTNLDFLPAGLAWVLPTVVGSVGINLTVRHYKSRLSRGRELKDLVELGAEGGGAI
jgi:uncharacterized membrane protein